MLELEMEKEKRIVFLDIEIRRIEMDGRKVRNEITAERMECRNLL